ncbi:MAG TPA: hypothetical protein PLL64_13115 [Rhodothermales bacterium]|nr:hypothetical protein [Rhodothermales bacterium]HRR09959.1 hypothetical protein [Rhodothermales bacterium]
MQQTIRILLLSLLPLLFLQGCKTTQYVGMLEAVGNEPFSEWILRTEDGNVIQLLLDETTRPTLQKYHGQLVRVRGQKGKGVLFQKPVTTLRLKCSKKDRNAPE